MKYNTKNNGSVRQRPDGRWEARFYIDGKRRSVYGDKQTDVVKKMREALTQKDNGYAFEPTRATLAQWLDTWLEEYVKPHNKHQTYTTYKTLIETHIKSELGRFKITALSPTQIQTFYNNLQRSKNLAPKTIKVFHGILHKSLQQAVKLHYIAANPCDPCILPRIEKKEIKPLTEQEIKRFLEEIENKEPLKNLLIVTLFTGMRKGEICGLSWKDIDFQSGTITIRRQLLRDKEKGGKNYIATTKSGKGRTITPAPFVMNILKEVRTEQIKNQLLFGAAWKNKFDVVFTDELGNYISPEKAYYHFKRVAERIGLPDARFHDLRHTYAVTSLQEGDDFKTVQENLGHASASFTLDEYGHVSEKMRKESSLRMEKYYSKIQT